MKTFKICNLIFTKKGVLIIAFGLFCTGILLGTFIALSLKNESNFNIPLFLIFNIPIWYFLKPKLKSEITEIKE